MIVDAPTPEELAPAEDNNAELPNPSYAVIIDVPVPEELRLSEDSNIELIISEQYTGAESNKDSHLVQEEGNGNKSQCP